jgi:hypothetical protein
MTAATKITAALAKYGRPMTLKRRQGTTNTFTTVTVNGIAQGYKPTELVGGIVQGDRKVTISNAEIAAASWPVPPRKNDQIDIDGVTCTVQGCETKYLGADVLAHVLWVRG